MQFLRANHRRGAEHHFAPWRCAISSAGSATSRWRSTASHFPCNAARWSASWARAAAGRARSCARIAGQLQPAQGERASQWPARFTPIVDTLQANIVTYIPQDDAFDEHLTIEENLDFAAAHPLAASLGPRPPSPHRREAGRTRPHRTARHVVGEAAQKDPFRRRAEATEYRPGYDQHRRRLTSSTSRRAAFRSKDSRARHRDHPRRCRTTRSCS